jgi:hypothetical protein
MNFQIMKYEIPLVKNVLKKFGSQLVFMVATKLHTVRLMPEPIPSGGPMEQNLKPGTVVDGVITNPYAPEFFLLGHVGRLVSFSFFFNSNNSTDFREPRKFLVTPFCVTMRI